MQLTYLAEQYLVNYKATQSNVIEGRNLFSTREREKLMQSRHGAIPSQHVRISTKKVIHQNDVKNKGTIAKLYPKGQNAKRWTNLISKLTKQPCLCKPLTD